MKNLKLLENQRWRQQRIMFINYLSCPHSFRDENPFGWKGEIESIVFREYNVEGCNYNDNDINWRVHQRMI